MKHGIVIQMNCTSIITNNNAFSSTKQNSFNRPLNKMKKQAEVQRRNQEYRLVRAKFNQSRNLNSREPRQILNMGP